MSDTSSSTSDSDVLELLLRTRFEGLSDAVKAARIIRDYAKAEKEAADAVRDSTQAQQELNDSRKRYRTSAGQGRSGGSFATGSSNGNGGGTATGEDGRRGRAPRYNPGPRERLSRIDDLLQEARSGGASADRIADLEWMQRNARRRVDATAPPTLGKAVKNAFMSSRFTVGKDGQIQFMPLVSSLHKVVAAAEESGVISSAARGALTEFMFVGEGARRLVGALDSFAAQARESAREFAANKLVTGGGLSGDADSARLMAYGQAVGTKGLPDEALRLHQNVVNGSNPWARMYALRFGLDMRPDPFGNQDYGAEYLRAIQSIRGIKDEREQIRALRSLGLGEDSRRLLDVSPDTWGMMENSARSRALIDNPFARRRQADTEARRNLYDQGRRNFWEPVGQQWDALKDWAARPFRDWSTGWMNSQSQRKAAENADDEWNLRTQATAQQSVKDAAKSFDAGKSRFRGAGKDVLPAPLPEPKLPSKVIRIHGDYQGRSSFSAEPAPVGLSGSIDMLVAVLMQLNRNLSGVYGGGDRARDAMPEKLTGRYLVAAANLHALHQNAL